MKRKMLIWLIVGICLVGIVGAGISIGSKLPQKDFDNTDFSNFSIGGELKECYEDSINVWCLMEYETYIDNGKEYELTKVEKWINADKGAYYDCVQYGKYDENACKIYTIESVLKDKIRQYEITERNKLVKKKTVDKNKSVGDISISNINK